MLLWYDLDQEWRTDAADVADCVDCLKPVFVHADGLGRRDLNLVVVIPGGKTLTDHNAFGCDDLDSGVVMVGAHEDWCSSGVLKCCGPALIPVSLFSFGSCGGGMGRPIARAVCRTSVASLLARYTGMTLAVSTCDISVWSRIRDACDRRLWRLGVAQNCCNPVV